VEVFSSSNLRLSTTTQPFYATYQIFANFRDASPGYDGAFDAIYLKSLAI
jgi:hypothetical protein